MKSLGVILDGCVYRYAQAPTFNDKYLSGDGVVFYIYALVASKKQPGLKAFKKVGRKASLPQEVIKELSAEQQEFAEEQKAKGNLWFLRVEGEGWDWSSPGGAKGVQGIQEVINYLKRFKSKDKVAGVEAIYIEINDKKKKNSK